MKDPLYPLTPLIRTWNLNLGLKPWSWWCINFSVHSSPRHSVLLSSLHVQIRTRPALASIICWLYLYCENVHLSCTIVWMQFSCSNVFHLQVFGAASNELCEHIWWLGFILSFYYISVAPRCVRNEKQTFGANIGSTIVVKCSVDAFPAPTSFSWGFNNSKDAVKIKESLYDMTGMESRLRYSTVSDHQFGHLYCWARNSMGVMSSPCIFNIIPATPPSSPMNCAVLNQTTDVLQVRWVHTKHYLFSIRLSRWCLS